jgi:hypothetical protein
MSKIQAPSAELRLLAWAQDQMNNGLPGTDTFKMAVDINTVLSKNKHLGSSFDEHMLKEYQEMAVALNRIGLLASSYKAYTKDFTTEVMGIIREALG